MESVTVLMLAATVNKIVSVVKAFGKDWNYVATQLTVWIAGTFLLALAAHAMLAQNMVILGARLGDWDGSSIVLGGIVLGSTGSFAYDWKKARDNSDTSAEPALFPRLTKQLVTAKPPAKKAAVAK